MADSEIDNLTVKKNAAILGNIGVGNPASEAALDVYKQGDGAVILRLSSERHWEFRQLGTGAGTALELKSVGGGGNKELLINTTGKVRVGTPSGRAPFEVNGNIEVVGDAPTYPELYRGQFRICDPSGKFVVFARTSDYAFIQSYNSQPLSLNPVGNNVGVGTGLPRCTLHISGTFLVTGQAYFEGNISLNNTLNLRPDGYHGIGWREKFGGQMVDGPVIFGWGGGALGCFDQAGERVALKWSKEGSISVAGKVAIGKANPAAALDVQGSIMVSEDVLLQGADCAEEFELDKACISATDPGTVMVLDNEGQLRPSATAYDKRVAGVVSGAGDLKPGIVLDRQPSRENRCAIALVGKVFCKVDASNGPVAVGDLLTTSATLGHAMKALDPAQAFGAVLGKALRPLPQGQGLIPILVALQ